MPVSTVAADRRAPGADLAALRPMLGELNDLKRIRAAGRGGSVAALAFARSWRSLLAGVDPAAVALRESALAVAAARLGAIDAEVLRRAGLGDGEAIAVLRRSFDAASGPIEPRRASALRAALGGPVLDDRGGETPGFVAALADQPRAGATCPGRPRLVLEPPESHAEHCFVTAVYAVIVAGPDADDLASPFLAGLAHHLHNAALPDSGFAGEELLGDLLGPIMARLTSEAMAGLPRPLAGRIRSALELTTHAETPEARAFHAADVLDRVLQMEQYARSAAFTTEVALGEMELVHAGPLQSYQVDVLRRAGLLL